MVVTDPLGRRVGYDPLRAVTYAEIPAASYDSSGLGDLQDDGTIIDVDPESKELYIHLPADGQYAATVTGTGTGRYTLNLVAYDVQHRFARFLVSNIPISVGEVHQYSVLFNSADMSSGTLATSGGFNGGGQRTAINQLLSYARPGQGRTSLPAGTTTYSLLVFYDAAVDAGSFQADLNGVSLTSSFHPVAGGSESVSIPLQSGRSVLKLSVTGSPGGHTGTDHDQLVFLVP